MKRFLIRCAIAGAMIGGAAAASFSAVSSTTSSAVPIGSSSRAAAPAVAAPPANVSTTTANVPAAPAAGSPPLPTGANGCVGGIVSTAAHSWHDLGSSLGQAGKALDQNVGKAIQAASTVACGKH